MVVRVQKHRRKIALVTLMVFVVVLFAFFRRGEEAEASAAYVVGWFLETDGISGAYHPGTDRIYTDEGEASQYPNIYEFDYHQVPIEYQEKQSEFPYTKYNSAAGTIGDYVFWLGGVKSFSYNLARDEIYRFDPYTDTLELVGHLPAPRTYAGYTTYEGKIYLVGGNSAPSIHESDFYNDILSFDGQNVSVVGTLPFGISSPAVVFDADGKLLIFGGTTESSYCNDFILEYDLETGTCTQIGTLPRGIRGTWRAVRVGDTIYLFITSESQENVTEIYEFYNGELRLLPVSIPQEFADSCSIAVGTKIFLFCGGVPYEQNGQVYLKSNVWLIDTEKIPPQKVDVELSCEGNIVTLTWQEDHRAVYYHVERSRDQESWQEIAVTTETSFSETLDPGKYYYRVYAENGAGVAGEYSDIVSVEIEPEPPAGLQASVDGREITLTWQPVAGASTYVVQRSTDGANWSTIAEVAETTYTDNNTLWNTTYYYRVISKTADGVTSAPSSEVNVTTMNLPAPTGLTVQLNGTQVALSWEEVEEAASYVVERSLDGETWSTIAEVSSNSYTDQNTQPHTEYYYRVRAKCSTCVSDPSEVKYVKTYENPLPDPEVVAGLTATWNGDRITVTWTRGENQLPEGRIVLWRQVDGGVWLPVKELSETDKEGFVWDDTAVVSGLNCRYELRLRGGASSGFKWYRLAASGWATGNRILLAPGGVRVQLQSDSGIITWEPVSGASSYEVQFSSDGGSTWQTVTVAGTSATVPRDCIARVRAAGHEKNHWSGTVIVP